MLKLKEDLLCKKSALGANNFHYPSEEEVLLRSGEELQTLPWIGGKGLQAFFVRRETTCLVVWAPQENLKDKG